MSQPHSGVVVDKADLSALSDLAGELRDRLRTLEHNAQPVPPVATPPLLDVDVPWVVPPIEPEPVVEGEPVAKGPSVPDFVPAFRTEPQPSPRPPRPGRPVVNWEIFAGGRLLNAAGAIVLVIGLTLLLKYAFDNNWITEAARIVMGVLAGGSLLGIGALVHRREKRWFADGLFGAGVGLLYLSGFASFQSYHLVPFPLAYGFMSLVTLVAFGIAVRYDSLPLALIGFAGGFATPFALGETIANEVGAASYLLLLDLGILAMAYVKPRWSGMQPAALLASYAAVTYWYQSNADVSDWLVSTFAVLSIWAAFFLAGIVRAARPGGTMWWTVADAVNAFACVEILAGALGGHARAFENAVLAMAAVYAATYLVVRRRNGLGLPLRVWSYAAMAALLATFDLHRFTGLAAYTALALQGLGLLSLEALLRTRFRAAYPNAPEGLWFPVVFALVPVVYILDAMPAWIRYSGSSFEFDLAGRDLALFVAFAIFIIAARSFRAASDGAAQLPAFLRQAAVATALIDLTLHAQGFRLVTGVALVALACAEIGTRRLLRDLEIDGLGLLAVSAVAIGFVPEAFGVEHIFRFEPLRNDRFVCGALLGLTGLVMAALYRRRSLLPTLISRVLRVGGIGAAILTSTIELHETFAQKLARLKLEPHAHAGSLDAQIASLASLEQLALSALWVAASLVLMTIGMRAKVKDLRLIALGLFDLTLLKAFFVDLAGLDMPYRIVSFIGLGLVLLGVSFLYQRLEGGAAAAAPSPALLTSP
jgi:uncharacterized membrane protein